MGKYPAFFEKNSKITPEIFIFFGIKGYGLPLYAMKNLFTRFKF